LKDARFSLSFEDISNSLRERFYVNVPFSLSLNTINEAVEVFFKFLEEPDEIKEHIDFTIAPKHRRGDVGFKHRDPSDDRLYNDHKDFFHFHPALFEKYSEFLQRNPTVYDFMLKAHLIWNTAYESVGNILKVLENRYPGAYSKVFETKNVHLLLRFLKYNWQSSGKYLAKPHYDAGSFTLAIAESCQGLRIGSKPENLVPVEHHDGNAVFMLSSNFKSVLDTQQLFAGWHDVIQLDDSFIGQPFARWAVVAFIEAHGVEALPRTETHKWVFADEGCRRFCN
jgi:hypothetical protein